MSATTHPSIIRPEIPSPPPTPLGLRQFLSAVRTNALTIWPDAAYEQPFTQRNFLGRLNVLLNDPEAIHHVLVGNHANYRRSRASIRILRPITGEGLLLSEGETWKLQRRTIAPALAPRVMPILARHVMDAASVAVERWTAMSGQPMNLLAEMQLLALDIAGRSMFSMQMDRYGPSMRRLLTQFSERHARPGLFDMLLPHGIPTIGDLRRERFRRRWMGLIEDILAVRLSEPMPDQPRDLLDLLRAAHDPDSGAAFSPGQLRDQVATMLLAGHETTAVTLFWALILLAQSPDHQQAIAVEAAQVWSGGQTVVEDIGGLVQTKAVINETLRLFPPAFTIVREALADDQAGAVKLPAGTVVMIAPWVLHRHRKLWTDPAAFCPSRFLPDAPMPPRFAFLPFGSGPRVCVGAQFAMTEAVLVVATLLRRFHVEKVGDRPVLPVAIVTTQPDHQAEVRLLLR